MIAGPAALAVALIILPGWIYWRLRATPRTARTALGELFEVVGAGTAATGSVVLVYVSVGDLPARVHLVTSSDLIGLDAATMREDLKSVVWTAAALVLGACLLAATVAWLPRKLARSSSSYRAETPIWVAVLGDERSPITLDLKDGRRLSGLLAGHSVDDEGTPTVWLAPPVTVTTPALSRRKKPQEQQFSEHALTVDGSEIAMIWSTQVDPPRKKRGRRSN